MQHARTRLDRLPGLRCPRHAPQNDRGRHTVTGMAGGSTGKPSPGRAASSRAPSRRQPDAASPDSFRRRRPGCRAADPAHAGPGQQHRAGAVRGLQRPGQRTGRTIQAWRPAVLRPRQHAWRHRRAPDRTGQPGRRLRARPLRRANTKQAARARRRLPCSATSAHPPAWRRLPLATQASKTPFIAPFTGAEALRSHRSTATPSTCAPRTTTRPPSHRASQTTARSASSASVSSTRTTATARPASRA
jgi:hypothetical protein